MISIFSFIDYALDSFGIRRKPKTIQMPVTSFCNSRCETCNVWKLDKKIRTHIDIECLEKILRDPYLKNVKNVGVNGGEPFMHPAFCEVVRVLSTLPKLKRIYLITNGLATRLILDKLAEAHKITQVKGIEILLTVSYDGIDGWYETVRGVEGGYRRVLETIQSISKDMKRYCERLSLGVTLSKYNINHISEIRESVEELNLPVEYHIAVPNRRIGTEGDYSRYSVLDDATSKQLALEFFYGRYKYSQGLRDKIRYFQNYYYLRMNGKARISSCQFRYRDITIDEMCNLYFCAKESNSLGHIDTSIRAMLSSDKAKAEHQRICGECSKCGHYVGLPTLRGAYEFAKETLAPGAWVAYRILSKVPI